MAGYRHIGEKQRADEEQGDLPHGVDAKAWKGHDEGDADQHRRNEGTHQEPGLMRPEKEQGFLGGTPGGKHGRALIGGMGTHLPGVLASATPIIESRVTKSSSSDSVMPSVPAGRRGITR